MKTSRHTNGPKLWLAFLTLLTVAPLITPSGAKAAERDGTMLFFPLEDIQHVLNDPSLPALSSLFSLSQPTSSFSWRAQYEAGRNSSPGRNTRDGNGLWADGYRLPGPHPLWGY
jgi:hypothetical protein